MAKGSWHQQNPRERRSKILAGEYRRARLVGLDDVAAVLRGLFLARAAADFAGEPPGRATAPYLRLPDSLVHDIVHVSRTTGPRERGLLFLFLARGPLRDRAQLLRETCFTGAELAGAELSNLKLRGVTMTAADLSEAVLVNADLSGVSLRLSLLTGADMSGSRLPRSALWGADLEGATLTAADLRGADLTLANLRAADLRGARLIGATLAGAELTGATLTDADLTGASLTEVDLTSVEGLSQAQIDNLHYDPAEPPTLPPSLELRPPRPQDTDSVPAGRDSDRETTEVAAAAAAPAEWPWPDALDAVTAAPDSHRVLFENDRLRVVEVVVAPGDEEPLHTHRWPSLMVIDSPARIRYVDGDGREQFESPAWPDGESAATAPTRSEWLEPEGPHSVKNIDEASYHAIRLEMKKAEPD